MYCSRVGHLSSQRTGHRFGSPPRRMVTGRGRVPVCGSGRIGKAKPSSTLAALTRAKSVPVGYSVDSAASALSIAEDEEAAMDYSYVTSDTTEANLLGTSASTTTDASEGVVAQRKDFDRLPLLLSGAGTGVSQGGPGRRLSYSAAGVVQTGLQRISSREVEMESVSGAEFPQASSPELPPLPDHTEPLFTNPLHFGEVDSETPQLFENPGVCSVVTAVVCLF